MRFQIEENNNVDVESIKRLLEGIDNEFKIENSGIPTPPINKNKSTAIPVALAFALIISSNEPISENIVFSQGKIDGIAMVKNIDESNFYNSINYTDYQNSELLNPNDVIELSNDISIIDLSHDLFGNTEPLTGVYLDYMDEALLSDSSDEPIDFFA